MANAVKYSKVADELKKEYLRDHLESVKILITSWMSELHLPEPLAPNERVWGWDARHRLPRQDNADELHILKHHLRTRALWSHYSKLELQLEEIWRLTKLIRLRANQRKEKQCANGQWKYTDDYVPLALWKAFDTALTKAIDLPFKIPGGKSGLSYGAYRIENSANAPGERSLIEDEYRAFIHSLSQAPAMKKLAKLWLETRVKESQISAIANEKLKAGDIFYECRFCRHLWR